jgi:hypothetical protein
MCHRKAWPWCNPAYVYSLVRKLRRIILLAAEQLGHEVTVVNVPRRLLTCLLMGDPRLSGARLKLLVRPLYRSLGLLL